MQRCGTPEDIAASISAGNYRLVAVDGFQASGKTTFARALAKLLNTKFVSADDYLNRNQGTFFDHLRLDDLASSLVNGAPCIFEGICALQILEAVDMKPDVFIYVKRMAS